MNSVVLFDNLLESLPTVNQKTIKYYECITVPDCTIFMLKHYLTVNKDLIVTSDEKRQYVYNKLFAYALTRSIDRYNDDKLDKVIDQNMSHETYTEQIWLNNINDISEYYTGNDGYIIYFVADIALKEIFLLLK